MRALILIVAVALLPLDAGAAPKKPSYDAVVAGIDAQRRRLLRSWRRAGGEAERKRVLKAARGLLIDGVTRRLAPRWLGTPWAFHGTTETPRKGKIACGYFVTTLLRDAGLRVERNRLARQAAEHIIKSLTGEEHIARFSDVPLRAFVDRVAKLGDGLFVVGLDYHVGLLRVDGDRVRFIHSSNVGCACVEDEDARTSAVLGASRYRVVGRISADDALIERWLAGRVVKTRGPHP